MDFACFSILTFFVQMEKGLKSKKRRHSHSNNDVVEEDVAVKEVDKVPKMKNKQKVLVISTRMINAR